MLIDISKMIDESIEDVVNVICADHEIVPGSLYGWNFKCVNSNQIIKFSVDYDAVVEFAKSYCNAHSSNLIIYNYNHEESERISFKR